MAKAIAFMLLASFAMAMGLGILAGGGGYAATSLTVAVDADDATLPVTSTDNFLDTDYVVVGSEEILYSGVTVTSFIGCVRGYEGTVATSHAEGTIVYTTSASVVNSALGFSIAATVDTMGLWSIITVPFNFFVKTLPQVVLVPYQFFRGGMEIIAVIIVLIYIAIIITIAMSFIGARRV